MTAEIVSHRQTEDSSAEKRWGAWVARGVEQDRTTAGRFRVVAVAIAVIAVGAAGFLMLR